MKKTILLQAIIVLLTTQQVFAQDCKTNADLEATPGKYLTAAQNKDDTHIDNSVSATDKSMAKKTLDDIEKTEAQSHTGFNLTGGNWENHYSIDGYEYLDNTRLAQYIFQSALYEYFCNKGKLIRNSEYSTVLRIYANRIPTNTLNHFLGHPFGSSMGEYDLGFQFQDWKNHKPVNVSDKLIALFTYLSCNNPSLVDAINTGGNYFQDVAEKDIKPGNRNNYITRYWFIRKKDIPVIVPVSRKEYLQSLLEYYEREKLYFPKLIAKYNEEHSSSVRQYAIWETDVNDKIAVVKKTLSSHDEKWLSAQAVINRLEDNSQNYKSKLAECTNYNRFWRFYDNENKSAPLYKYNPDYFKPAAQGAAKPQLISIAFRYVAIPSSMRILNNFTKTFGFEALKKMMQQF